ncbi:hypothetical protein NDU88_002668 [Pleurodeles waltl]|uniref:Uncharacterized protein n=1 Tax=Pleurodeles waltl TaxID=8319 RepID=A0AAV7MBP0_PLEWA|nr:hypothetical protein NDU88_002668 [Pleurodeles waltl]
MHRFIIKGHQLIGLTARNAGEYKQNLASFKERNARVTGRVPREKTGLGNVKTEIDGALTFVCCCDQDVTYPGLWFPKIGGDRAGALK